MDSMCSVCHQQVGHSVVNFGERHTYEVLKLKFVGSIKL